MPLRLIDPKHTKIIDVSGTKIHIRSMTDAERMRVIFLWRSESEKEDNLHVKPEIAFTQNMVANYGEIAKAITPAIVKIEDYEDRSILDVLMNLADISDFMQIFTAVMEFSNLSEPERKNLNSSPVGMAAKPAGTNKAATGAQIQYGNVFEKAKNN